MSTSRALWLLALAACSERFTPSESPLDGSTAPPAIVDAAMENEGHGDHDGGTCETIGRTGGADTCQLFAYCGHRHFVVDCAARFTCVCSEPEIDGGPTSEIAAQPIYCESAPTDLTPAFAAARAACGW